MKIEYDPVRDLIYVWFAEPGQAAAETETVAPGVFADFDAAQRLVGIEILDASEVLRQNVQFEFAVGPKASVVQVHVGE